MPENKKVLKLYDTYTRSKREFIPLKPTHVGLYCCGPTVYDFAHIGNLRTYLFEDILRRVLEFNGYAVRHVMNITDVGHLTSDADTGEDRMEKGSRRTGKTAWKIAETYTDAFKADLARLNIQAPHIWCRATDHIKEQIDFIQCIESKGFTYRTSDGIYFDTSKIPDYGYLARLHVEGLQAGRRVNVGEKRHITDFALWKFSTPNEKKQMEWKSPWGTGSPGWHIECSAMAVKYLGNFFDIHCGGEDHIMVHHPNEIAQNQACYGTRLANFWMHSSFLQIDNSRMGKSMGNFVVLKDIIALGYDALAWRFYCLNAHYRSKLNFSTEGLDQAKASITRLRNLSCQWGKAGSADDHFMAKFQAQVNDDLNTPRAMATVWELTASDLPDSAKKATLLEFDKVLGLGLDDWQPTPEAIPDEVKALAERREFARRSRNWNEADIFRDQIHQLGYEIEDTPDGYQLRMKHKRKP
jgi:cysteinyl-tRNA synthetase